MSSRPPRGGARRGCLSSNSYRNGTETPGPGRGQPTPATPGLTKRVIREHARRIFRDRWTRRALSLKEWRLAEEDLARKLEAEAF